MSRFPLRPRLLLLIACVIAFALPGPAMAVKHKHKPAKQQIADLEEEWKNATLTSDAAVLDRLLSEEYVGISWSGQINTKAMQIDRIAKRDLAITRMDLSDFKVKVVGAVAIVTARAEVVGTNDGVQITGAFRYTRIYQRQASGVWKITNFEATRVPAPGHQDRPDHPDHARHGAAAAPPLQQRAD